MSAISIYRPGRGCVIPSDGIFSGDFYAERAVLHPTLIFVPFLVESLHDRQPGIVAPYDYPPKAVAEAVFAREWEVTMSVEGAGVTLTATAETIPRALGDTTWSSEIKSGIGASRDFSERPGNWLDISIAISGRNTFFAWGEEGEWFPGLTVDVVATDNEDGLSSSARIGGFSGTGYGDSGVTVRLGGHDFVLPYANVPELTISGLIELTPKNYLSVE